MSWVEVADRFPLFLFFSCPSTPILKRGRACSLPTFILEKSFRRQKSFEDKVKKQKSRPSRQVFSSNSNLAFPDKICPFRTWGVNGSVRSSVLSEKSRQKDKSSQIPSLRIKATEVSGRPFLSGEQKSVRIQTSGEKRSLLSSSGSCQNHRVSFSYPKLSLNQVPYLF